MRHTSAKDCWAFNTSFTKPARACTKEIDFHDMPVEIPQILIKCVTHVHTLKCYPCPCPVPALRSRYCGVSSQKTKVRRTFLDCGLWTGDCGLGTRDFGLRHPKTRLPRAIVLE